MRRVLCRSQLSGSQLKSMARCHKMYLSSVRREIVLRMNPTQFEMDESYWNDLANALTDLKVDDLVQTKLNHYWKSNDYSKQIKDFYFDIYSTKEEPTPYDTMIDHA